MILAGFSNRAGRFSDTLLHPGYPVTNTSAPWLDPKRLIQKNKALTLSTVSKYGSRRLLHL